jgi:hypothetical protein
LPCPATGTEAASWERLELEVSACDFLNLIHRKSIVVKFIGDLANVVIAPAKASAVPKVDTTYT